jgi:prophage DNA circulation protein
VDLDGRRTTDSARQVGTGITMPNFGAHSLPTSMGVNRDPIYLPNATFARVTGNHINDGARSAFNHVIVIVDSSKLAGQKIAPLVDYIAMLSLTQLNELDTCQQLPSIVNAMTPNCDQRVEGMTNIDVAYLRALYRMGSDKSLIWQQNDIADQMTAALASPSALQPEMEHLAAPAQSSCAAPDTPGAADGAAITSDQLKASVAAARHFMALSDAYQDCLGKEINGQKAAATPDKAVADRDLTLVASNQKMKETVGASVNAAIAAYKKAHPAP